MQKIIFYFVFSMALLSCQKLEDPADNPANGKAYLKFIHANSLAPALDLYSQYYNQTSKIGSQITYKNSLPQIGYMILQSTNKPSPSGVGTYWIHTRPSLTSDTFHKPLPIFLANGSYYTIFNIDSSGTPKLAIFNDAFQKPDSGLSSIRFFNGKFESGNLVLSNGINQTHSVGFMEISNFINIPSGTYDFVLKDNDGNILSSINNYTLKNQAVYTFYFSDELQVTQQSE